MKLLTWLKNEIVSYPAGIAGALSAVLSYIISQGVLNLSADQTALFGAVFTTVLTLLAGILTDDESPSLWLAALNAVGALFAGFATSQSAQHVAVVIGIIAAVVGAFQHLASSPKYGPLAKFKAAQSPDGTYTVTGLPDGSTSTMAVPSGSTVTLAGYEAADDVGGTTAPTVDTAAADAKAAAAKKRSDAAKKGAATRRAKAAAGA